MHLSSASNVVAGPALHSARASRAAGHFPAMRGLGVSAVTLGDHGVIKPASSPSSARCRSLVQSGEGSCRDAKGGVRNDDPKQLFCICPAMVSTAICFSPSAAMISPHWWPCFLPAGGHQISPPSGLLARDQTRGLTPLPAVAWASR